MDGFAPSQNPDMWQERLFEAIASHSSPHATLASFTAAGHVRRGLEAAGFEVERHQGFGLKRHRITGRIKATPQKPANPISPDRQKVVIIGAGIAGASVAAALKPAGYDILVLGQGMGGRWRIWQYRGGAIPPPDRGGKFFGTAFADGYSYARWLARLYGADLADQAISYAWNDREVTRQAEN